MLSAAGKLLPIRFFFHGIPLIKPYLVRILFQAGVCVAGGSVGLCKDVVALCFGPVLNAEGLRMWRLGHGTWEAGACSS